MCFVLSHWWSASTLVSNNVALTFSRFLYVQVETIGDSYLAVTGLPEPQVKHAVIMARFAWQCLVRMGEITKELEVSLGPDTADLAMRYVQPKRPLAIHSRLRLL